MTDRTVPSCMETMFEGKTLAVVQNTIKNVVPSTNESNNDQKNTSSEG